MARKIFISCVVWAVGTVLTMIVFFAMALAAALFPFDTQRRRAHAQCFWWADAVVALNPYWHITARGLENIDRNRTYVIIANHRSLADIVVMYKTRMQFKWVAKDSLFTVPFIGWNLSIARHIKIERGKFSSIKKVYREAALWLRGGMSVLFFPEGTRSETDEMRDFQNGAFKLAIKEKVPILPVAIEGTGEAIPKGTWIFTANVPATVTVLPAIETSGMAPADYGLLRDRARAAIESA